MTEEIINENVEDINASSDDGSGEDTKTIIKGVPYDKFKRTHEKLRAEEAKSKELDKKLKVYEEAEVKRTQDKLLEKEEYTELLKVKNTELETLKTEKENLRKESLLEKVRGKIINSANKEGAVDSEDILRFVDISDLLDLDAEKLEENIKQRISKIKVDKAHLFKTSTRDAKENGHPYSANTTNTKLGSNRVDPVMEALRKSRQ